MHGEAGEGMAVRVPRVQPPVERRHRDIQTALRSEQRRDGRRPQHDRGVDGVRHGAARVRVVTGRRKRDGIGVHGEARELLAVQKERVDVPVAVAEDERVLAALE